MVSLFGRGFKSRQFHETTKKQQNRKMVLLFNEILICLSSELPEEPAAEKLQ